LEKRKLTILSYFCLLVPDPFEAEISNFIRGFKFENSLLYFDSNKISSQEQQIKKKTVKMVNPIKETHR
jgi:hypothetical protein